MVYLLVVVVFFKFFEVLFSFTVIFYYVLNSKEADVFKCACL